MMFQTFSVLNAFLQIPEGWNSWGTADAIIVAIGTVAGVVIPFLYSRKQDRDTRILEFIKDVDAEIAEHLKNDENLKTRDEMVTHAYVYLEILDRIAFLIDHGKVPKLFSIYYKNFFNYGITMMLWYAYAWQDKHNLDDNWPSLTKWFTNINKKDKNEQNGLHPYPAMHLPSLAYEITKIMGDVEELDKKIETITKTGVIHNAIITELNKELHTEINESVREKLEEKLGRQETKKEVMKERWHKEMEQLSNQDLKNES